MRIYLIFLFLTCHRLLAQPFTYDNYYLFPIKPGEQNYLAGTMGEMRASHFHAGLDIKTEGRTGLPVYAAADGYISRIKISTGGYGQALYLKHQNGTTTVYAHLDRFIDEVEEYVLGKQYENESFGIQLFPDKDQFTFRKGEVIAYSGNTGSSSGPHLHFEIRDRNQHILDPLKFNFEEIKDNIRPILKSVAFVSLDGGARINNTFGRYEFDVLRTDDIYSTRVPISLSGNIGIEIYAYDLLNGVYNRNGIPVITLMVDEDTVFRQAKFNLSFSKQRNVLTHMDYETYRRSGKKYNKLFIDDGNTSDFYSVASRGYNFSDSVHTIKIYLEDSYGNISTFETTVNNRKIINRPDPNIDRFEIFRNHLHFKAAYNDTLNHLKLSLRGVIAELSPYRADSKAAYYLWDLRKGIPDSVDLCGEIIHTGIYSSIPSQTEISFHDHDMELEFRKNTLFDTLYLRFNKSIEPDNGWELFDFPHGDVPLNSSAKVTLKPINNYSEKHRVYFYNRGNLSYVGGEWGKDNTISFYSRSLETFTIVQDSIPPTIEPSIINNRNLYFKIEDDLSGIQSFKATLNGKFLLMKYEYKKNLIWSVNKDKNIPLKGEFLLRVEDNSGNVNTYKRTL